MRRRWLLLSLLLGCGSQTNEPPVLRATEARLPAFRAAAPRGLVVDIPATTKTPVRIDSGDVSVALSFTGDAPLEATKLGRASASLLLTTTEDGFEDLHLTRGETTTVRLEGESVRDVRVVDGRVIVDGARGPRIATDPAFAVDAKGARFPVSPRVVREGAHAWTVVLEHDASAVPPVLVDPMWKSVGSLSMTRSSPAVAVLASGKILVAGGYGTSTSASTAEVFDVATGTTTPTGNLVMPRTGAYGFTLPSGKVLVAGGTSGSVTTTTAELWDPATGKFTATGSMTSEHVYAVSAQLADGRPVVLTGELFSFASTSVVDAYDPSTGTWKALAPIPKAVSDAAATVLATGELLVTGGTSAAGTEKNAALYDPKTNAWTPVGDMATKRAGHASVLLGDGRVVVAGGSGMDFFSSSEIFDPKTRTFTAGPSMSTPRQFPLRASFGGHAYLATGTTNSTGGSVSTVEVFDGSTWSSAGSLATKRLNGKLVVAGGKLVAVGGIETTSVEVFDAPTAGAPCKAPGDCVTGFCVDGVCCDKACDGACDACDVSGKVGTCSPVDAQKPHGARSCGDFALCTMGACATSCSGDGDCASSAFCEKASSKCIGKRANGGACKASNECTSGACVEGTCCATSCSPYKCSDDGATCGSSCTADKDCATGAICKDGKCVPNANTCNADFTAIDHPDGTSESCGMYRCRGGACLVTCNTSDECAAGVVCDTTTNKCAPPPTGDSGGCSYGRSSTSWWPLALLAWFASRRRR